MSVVRDPTLLPAAERAVAVGTFDGVHRGHAAVVGAVRATGLRATVVTFHPHPREVLGYEVQLLTTLDRRVELLTQLGADDVVVVEFTMELSRLSPTEFVDAVLTPIGTQSIVAGESFRFGRARSGDVDLLRQMGFEVLPVPVVEGVSSTRIRESLRQGEVRAAAEMLGRPYELEGPIVAGDQRGGTLGFPTANLAVPPNLLVPAHGIYAGEALGHRAAVSIGVNPHYGGQERRIEAFLLDFEGDLYGQHIRLELWRRLRQEQAFESEEQLIGQIAKDVEATREATKPV